MSKNVSENDDAEPQLILYQTEDGRNRIDVRMENDTVWLTQAAMAELFQTTKQNVSLHIKNILEEGELSAGSTVKEYLTVQIEGDRQVRRSLDHYNLDMILAVGYRVRSPRGTQFRQWATERLHEYLVKGFTLDDERLKGNKAFLRRDAFFFRHSRAGGNPGLSSFPRRRESRFAGSLHFFGGITK